MLIIPAIDLRGGKCVRLCQGRAEEMTVFSDDPVAMGLKWQEAGAKWLHLVDLDGAFSGSPQNLEAIRQLRQALDIPIELPIDRPDNSVEKKMSFKSWGGALEYRQINALAKGS